MLLCFSQNSLFSLVLIFPSRYVKSLRSQTLLIGGPVWNNKCKCQRSAHAFPLSGHSFGFPQVVRECTFDLCKAPPEAGTSILPCVGVGPRATHVIRLVPCARPLRHNAIDLSQPRGRFAQVIVRAHDLGNPKLCDRFAQMNLVGRCMLAAAFLHTHQSVETRNSRELPCEKTNFCSSS